MGCHFFLDWRFWSLVRFITHEAVNTFCRAGFWLASKSEAVASHDSRTILLDGFESMPILA